MKTRAEQAGDSPGKETGGVGAEAFWGQRRKVQIMQGQAGESSAYQVELIQKRLFRFGNVEPALQPVAEKEVPRTKAISFGLIRSIVRSPASGFAEELGVTRAGGHAGRNRSGPAQRVGAAFGR